MGKFWEFVSECVTTWCQVVLGQLFVALGLGLVALALGFVVSLLVMIFG